MDIVVRDAAEGDLASINEIYNHYVATSPATFDLDPVSLEARAAWLAEHPGGRYRALVAEDGDGLVVGYATSGPVKLRRAYETSVETSVYVREGHGGRGIGTALYTALFDALAGEDLHRAYAGITAPNPASRALHERFGFRLAGRYTEQGRKFGRYWDVEWFERPM
jgi:phosphinothricin acetyltransferase